MIQKSERLRKDEYDPTAGRIIRRHSKTQKSPNTPVVSYKLCPETQELLDWEINNYTKHPKYPKFAECLLLNSKGFPLWREYLGNDGQVQKSDSITSAFKRLVVKLGRTNPYMPSISYYAHRRTGSTLIYNEPQFRGLDELWLGHAPKTVRGKHYNADDITILDACLAWLHGRIFGSVLSEGESVKIGKF